MIKFSALAAAALASPTQFYEEQAILSEVQEMRDLSDEVATMFDMQKGQTCDPTEFTFQYFKDADCTVPAGPMMSPKPSMYSTFSGKCSSLGPIGMKGKFAVWTCDEFGANEHPYHDKDCTKIIKPINAVKGLQYNWGQCTFLPVLKQYVILFSTQDF